MPSHWTNLKALTGFLLITLAAASCTSLKVPDSSRASHQQADHWRAERRLIDLHQHINYTEAHLTRAVRIMDKVGIGVAVNLSGGTVTRKGDAPSDFARNKELADRLFPGRRDRFQPPDAKEILARRRLRPTSHECSAVHSVIFDPVSCASLIDSSKETSDKSSRVKLLTQMQQLSGFEESSSPFRKNMSSLRIEL